MHDVRLDVARLAEICFIVAVLDRMLTEAGEALTG